MKMFKIYKKLKQIKKIKPKTLANSNLSVVIFQEILIILLNGLILLMSQMVP